MITRLSMHCITHFSFELLQVQVSPALTVIPEYIPENIGDTIRLMG